MIKRIFDFCFAVLLIVASLPIMLVVSLVVFATMGWPILFTQIRPGYKEKLFKVFKFRTMQNTVDKNGNLLDDSERLTRTGRLLRETSLDELPQLFNVLGGSLSFVGPRPLLPEYLELYSNRQRKRHDCKPGITGWAQINGRNKTTWSERLENDVWYVENQSILLDLKIIALTFVRVFKRTGISSENHATFPKFKGEQ